jgi:hypothetical protein
VTNPIEPTPQNNHDGRPKRRRLIGPSPGDTPAIDRYVSSFNRSPVAASIPNQSPENRPSDHDDDDDSFADRRFTLDLSLLPPPTSPSAIVAAVQAAANAQLDQANDVSNAFVRASPTFLPLKDIPHQELQIIKDALRDVYRITEPRDFQLQAIHYLCFYDNPTMVLLRAAAGGKSLVPLTTLIIRTGAISTNGMANCTTTLQHTMLTHTKYLYCTSCGSVAVCGLSRWFISPFGIRDKPRIANH